MNKFIISAIASCLIAGASTVGATDYISLKVEPSGGEAVTLSIADAPRFTAGDEPNSLKAEAGDAKYVFRIDPSVKVTFSTEASLASVTESSGPHFTLLPGRITATGMRGGEAVDLYNISGRKVACARADASGSCSLETGMLTPGIYLLNIKNITTVKFEIK